MRGSGGLAASTLEVDDRYDLHRLSLLSPRHIVSLVGLLVGLEIIPELEHLVSGVVSATTDGLNLRSFPVRMELPQVRLGDTHEVRYFSKLKLAQSLASIRRVLLAAQHMQRA